MLRRLSFILSILIYIQTVFSFNITQDMEDTCGMHIDNDKLSCRMVTSSCDIIDTSTKQTCCSSKSESESSDNDSGCECPCCSNIVPVFASTFYYNTWNNIIKLNKTTKSSINKSLHTYDYKDEDFRPPKLFI